MRTRRGTLLAGLACAVTVAAGCTTSDDPVAEPPAGSSPSATASESPSATASGTVPGGAAPSAPATGKGRAAEPTEPAASEPLVLAMHHTRRPLAVPRRLAQGVVDGNVPSWAPLGGGRGPLRVVGSAAAVTRDRDAIAVLPASAVGPSVQAITVAGVHPFRRPAAYPLRVPAEDEPGPVVTMTVVGDIMLGRRVGQVAAAAGDPALPLRPMQQRLASADITVGNLESTLSRAGPPTQGSDSFAAPPAVRAGLRDAGFDVIGLANNHLGDYGDAALVETVRLLRRGGFATFGAGRDARAARQPAIVERRGVRFGFLGFNAIGETPEAGPGRPGADSVSMPPRTGPLDREALRAFLARVRRLDARVDVVVVLPHWGTQYTNRPEPVQHEVADRLVAAGADLVVGGHPHWVQGAAMVHDRLVVHSLGNFVFDMDFMDQTQVGVVLELTYWGDELKAADFVPYRMDERFVPRVEPWPQGRSTLQLMWETSGPGFRPPVSLVTD